jgi:hypothetical protein
MAAVRDREGVFHDAEGFQTRFQDILYPGPVSTECGGDYFSTSDIPSVGIYFLAAIRGISSR